MLVLPHMLATVLYNELAILFVQSAKFKSLFKEVAKSVQGSFQSIRPLCPTRWTVRSSAIRAVLDQYESVMLALNEMAAGSSDTATKANVQHDRFQQGNVVLGLLLARGYSIEQGSPSSVLEGRCPCRV